MNIWRGEAVSTAEKDYVFVTICPASPNSLRSQIYIFCRLLLLLLL